MSIDWSAEGLVAKPGSLGVAPGCLPAGGVAATTLHLAFGFRPALLAAAALYGVAAASIRQRHVDA